MEEDIADVSTEFQGKSAKSRERRIERRIESAVAAGEKQIAYENAHNEKLLLALDTIREFLVERKRVCYGGTAMNAILPKKLQFYNPEVDLPDYDFFTPDMDGDIDLLVKKLRAQGFDDVYHKVGIHQGTKKILVNFSPVADITAINPSIYNVFLKRSLLRNGIHYTDPDILRLMMYLELSRPKGMLSRWEKVFQRLQLINKVFPPKFTNPPRSRPVTRKAQTALAEVSKHLVDFCIENQRTIVSGPLDEFYNGVIFGKPRIDLIHNHKDVLGFLSPTPQEDALALQKELGGHPAVQSFLHEAKDEIVPEHIELRHGGKPVALVFKEVACHAYLNFPIDDGRSIAVGSLDTLITLYYTFAIFTVRARTLFPRIDRKIANFVILSEKNRGLVNPNVPSFPLTCRGYQKGFSTLLREKFHRVQREREGTRQTRKKTSALKDRKEE
jgi:hypothetical protein